MVGVFAGHFSVTIFVSSLVFTTRQTSFAFSGSARGHYATIGKASFFIYAIVFAAGAWSCLIVINVALVALIYLLAFFSSDFRIGIYLVRRQPVVAAIWVAGFTPFRFRFWFWFGFRAWARLRTGFRLRLWARLRFGLRFRFRLRLGLRLWFWFRLRLGRIVWRRDRGRSVARWSCVVGRSNRSWRVTRWGNWRSRITWRRDRWRRRRGRRSRGWSGVLSRQELPAGSFLDTVKTV